MVVSVVLSREAKGEGGKTGFATEDAWGMVVSVVLSREARGEREIIQ